jgi:hypothetical protein
LFRALCFLALALYCPLPPVACQFVADAAVAVVMVVNYLISARICQPRASIWPLVLSMPRRNDVIHQLVDVAQRSRCVSWSIVINYHSTLLIVLKRPSPFFRSAPIREPVQSGLGWLITRSGSRCFSCPNNPVRFMLRAAYWLLEILFTGTTCLWSIIGQLTTSTM